MTKQYEIRSGELGIGNESLGMLRQCGDIDVAVKRKHIVRRSGLLHILAPGRLGDLIHRVGLPALAAGAAQEHQRRA